MTYREFRHFGLRQFVAVEHANGHVGIEFCQTIDTRLSARLSHIFLVEIELPSGLSGGRGVVRGERIYRRGWRWRWRMTLTCEDKSASTTGSGSNSVTDLTPARITFLALMNEQVEGIHMERSGWISGWSMVWYGVMRCGEVCWNRSRRDR